MVKNLPNLKKETDKQIQEAEGPKQDEPKHTYTKTIKMAGREGTWVCLRLILFDI